MIRFGVVGLALLLGTGAVGSARGQENKWGFGTDLGFISGTVNNTVFALNFQADYYVAREFSIGPMFQWAPAGDLKQYAFAGVARYHFEAQRNFNIVPFAGVGLIHADLTSATVDRNDTSYYIPMGATFEYRLTPKLALANTVMLNLYNINLSPPPGPKDTTSVTVLFGLRFGP
jgi:hypothetical protein